MFSARIALSSSPPTEVCCRRISSVEAGKAGKTGKAGEEDLPP